MPVPVSLLGPDFIPSSVFSGNTPASVVRGSNAVIRTTPAGEAKIENYPGSLDLGEDYDLAAELITGTITFVEGELEVVGAGTDFFTELRQGHPIQAANGEPIVPSQIIDPTHFLASRPFASSAAAVQARHFYRLSEMNRQRVVLRRGNAVTEEKKDIIVVGDGKFFLNGVDTGFVAEQRPKRLQRETDGSLTEYPIGFTDPPATLPVVSVDTLGTKGMPAGKYSHRYSWWNSVTKGHSNSTEALKQTAAPADITIAANGRMVHDFTDTLGAKTFVDADVTIATGVIHIVGHGLTTGDSVRLRTTGALPVATAGGGLTAFTGYFAIVIDVDHFKLARTAKLAAVPTPIVYASAAGGGTHTFYTAPANADGIKIWSSQFGSLDTNEQLFSGGTWLRSRDFKFSELDAANKLYLEYLDGELGAVVSGDNDQPPKCEWITQFANTRFYVSVFGKIGTDDPDGTSPGNFVVMEKDSNSEAAPSAWRVSMGDEIAGFGNGAGRLFCLTPTSVPFVTPTGKSELARLVPTLLDMPFTERPFWTRGGISPYNILITAFGDVFIWAGKKLLRSPSNADANTVPYELSLPVRDLTTSFFDGHVLLGDDPENQQVCIIASATKKNDDGYWITEILPYSLERNQWQPLITLSKADRDQIVSGCATVNNRLEMLVGGRVSGGGHQLSTIRYDEPGSGDPVDYYIALAPTDNGEKLRSKMITWFMVTGRTTNGVLQVHGANWSQNFSMDDVEKGINSISGDIALGDTTDIEISLKKKFMIKNLRRWLLRYSGTYRGTGDVDSIHELLAGVGFHGISQ